MKKLHILFIKETDESNENNLFYDFEINEDHPIIELLERIHSRISHEQPVEEDDICHLEDSLTADVDLQLNPNSVYAGELENISRISRFPINCDNSFDRVYYYYQSFLGKPIQHLYRRMIRFHLE